jgi:hypothetical protein
VIQESRDWDENDEEKEGMIDLQTHLIHDCMF